MRPPILKEKEEKMQNENPIVSIIIIDSRSDKHPSWVNQSIESAKNQNVPVEVIVVDNIGRPKTIGQCWNEGVRLAKTPFCFFLGDDDYIAYDLIETLYRWMGTQLSRGMNIVCMSSNMTAINDETKNQHPLVRQHTGMWVRDYLLKHPFNEKLLKGIDREYIEETIKRGELIGLVEYAYSYYYRRHNDYRCAGDIIFHKEPSDFYFVTTNRIFLSPIVKEFEKEGTVFVDPNFDIRLAEKAKVVWMEWANEKAIDVSNTKLNAIKILRIHAFEAFTEYAHKINWNGFDYVIFIDNYIKDYVEKQFGKVNGAVVIPNGVDITKFDFSENVKNNKIAYAGYLTRKKGIGELLLIAKSLPEYEFHLAGKYQENDIADWFNQKKPDNVFVHEWKYDGAMRDFYKDKTYILNTSMRESQGMTLMEGMACGLKPIVSDWIGADDVYGEEYVYKNIEDIRKMLAGSYEPQKYRKFIEDNYSFDTQIKKIKNLILEKVEA